MMFLIIKNILYKNGYLYFICSLILIFDPYRAHLSIHILKDTLIIFSLISTVYFLNTRFTIFAIFSIIFGCFLRLQFMAYLIVIIPFLKKNFNNRFTFFLLLIIFLFSGTLEIFSSTINVYTPSQTGLSFRDFDKTPNFVDYVYPYGGILRSFIWPIIRIFNLAILFSPVYFLFFFQSLALMLLLFYSRYYSNYKILFFFILLALIALSAPGYNSYLRYTQPVITVLYLAISIHIIKLKSSSKKTNKR